MARPPADTAVLTIRIPSTLERRLVRAARRRHRTRSEVAREILEAGLQHAEPDLDVEARRQSLLVSRRRSEQETLRVILEVADLRGWR
jgi:predicted DNA-binding protein